MYQVLYRKWRPNCFEDVVGQRHVTDTLRNELKAGRAAHAYLFTGSRGTGKTTCAKILAKAFNCEHPVDGDPCNECEICRGIDSGAILDVVEIDAASNNGVDNIRDLREEANYTPVSTKYRVYIIDEVHMLSIGAFNALLKTLEEPPEHVKFILATTEVHKLPSTILSRCQRFDFKRIEPEDIAARLQTVSEGEKITLDNEAAMLIARTADGALRDALSLLDQCAGHSQNVTAELVGEVAGLTGRDYLFDMADYIHSRDCSKALFLIDKLHNSSCDMERLCSQLIGHFRNLMIAKTVDKTLGDLIICTKGELEKLREQSGIFTLESIIYTLDVLEETLGSLRRGLNRRVETEMAIVRLCSESLDSSTAALTKRIAELEAAVRRGGTLRPTAEKPEEKSGENASDETPSAEVAENTPFARAEAETPVERERLPDGELSCWAEILDELGHINAPFRSFLMGSSAFVNGDYIVVTTDNSAAADYLKIKENSRSLREAIFTVTGIKYKIGIKRTDAPSAPKDPLAELLERAQAQGINIES